MTAHEYHAAPGLSQSAMKDLAISPLRFWHKWLRPDREPEEPTAEMRLGTALHCAILEPAEFDKRYVRQLPQPEDCLETINDLRQWLRDKGREPKGTRKDELVAQVMMVDSRAPVWDVMRQRHAEAHADKFIFSHEDWLRVIAMAAALRDEPHVAKLLEQGKAEQDIFRNDEETGVLMKAKIDWWRDDCTVDFKTFTAREGQTIDASVAREILYRGYYRQAYFYSKLRGWPDFHGPFIIPFVESEEPHEVRIRSLSPGPQGNNLYWSRAALEVRGMLRLYAECMERFGLDKPWRWAQEVVPLRDEELPGMIYA